jgi:DNA-binding FadR family transcriptional regulator
VTTNREASLDYIFEPVSSQTAIDQTLTRLENAIKLGLLEPGSRLPAERELCLRLGISRSTLRQALTTLAKNGHLRAVRGRGGGTFVATDPPAREPQEHLKGSWRDICDQRRAVELGTAALAAARAKTADIHHLRDLLDRMVLVRENYDAHAMLDRRLHIYIAEMSGSRPLLSMCIRLQGMMCDLITAIPVPDFPLAKAHEQHVKLVDAIAVGDEELAIRAMSDHLNATEQMLKQALA